MPKANVREVARALNLMNDSYLLDAFGREPRITEAEAVRNHHDDLDGRDLRSAAGDA